MLSGMTTLQALILAVVEGLTEYLPVSSTGHLIITSSLMGISQESFTKDFTIIVQFGAILSVLFLYWKRFLTSLTLYYKLLVAFLPAAVVGLLVKDHIDLLLGNVYVVAVALIVGGVALLFVDRWFEKQESRLIDSGKIDQVSYGQALGIGMVQCLAFIPGVSRSAATIIGGLSMKLTRKSAAEFSFFLAVPTLTAATGLKLLKIYKTIEPEQISLIVLGNVVSFIVGAITIKAFLGFLTRRGFFAFGVYRIVVGAVILILLATGHDLQLL
jgi:undecaprenyl-diphosphatase